MILFIPYLTLLQRIQQKGMLEIMQFLAKSQDCICLFKLSHEYEQTRLRETWKSSAIHSGVVVGDARTRAWPNTLYWQASDCFLKKYVNNQIWIREYQIIYEHRLNELCISYSHLQYHTGIQKAPVIHRIK